MNEFSIRLNAADFDGLVDGLADDAEAAARPAAQAGAQVLYDAVKRNVAGLRKHTGNLAASIYQVYSKSESDANTHVYHVSWNAKKAPHGHLVEYGYLQRYLITFDPKTKRFITHKDKPLPTPKRVGAKPFIRPAAAQLPAAADAMRDRWFAELAERGVPLR